MGPTPKTVRSKPGGRKSTIVKHVELEYGLMNVTKETGKKRRKTNHPPQDRKGKRKCSVDKPEGKKQTEGEIEALYLAWITSTCRSTVSVQNELQQRKNKDTKYPTQKTEGHGKNCSRSKDSANWLQNWGQVKAKLRQWYLHWRPGHWYYRHACAGSWSVQKELQKNLSTPPPPLPNSFWGKIGHGHLPIQGTTPKWEVSDSTSRKENNSGCIGTEKGKLHRSYLRRLGENTIVQPLAVILLSDWQMLRLFSGIARRSTT